MGACFSDVKGGQQAAGEITDADFANGGANNDAIDFFLQSHGFEPLFTQLQLSLSGTQLSDRDILSKSDPMAVVYMKKRDGTLEELGRTEVVMNSLDPNWVGKIPVVYNFEIVQPLVFRVYDVDTKYHNIPVKELILSEQDFLGEATCFLSELVTKQNQRLTLNLHNKNQHGDPNVLGTLTIQSLEFAAPRNSVEIVLRCVNLENKDMLSKSDPFLRISTVVENGGTVPIYKTEVVNNNLNPTWRSFYISGSKSWPLVIECFDFNTSGNHELLGKLQKSILDLEKLHNEKAGANLVRPYHGRDKVLKSQLLVDKCHETQIYTFLDYISSGFELNFVVAIDFTTSNGNPRYPRSLHYIDPSGHLNSYQRAILDAGEVLQFYDSDKRFPAWGFGGKKPDGDVSYCFNLNLNPRNSEVDGVEGIMAAYAHALKNVALAGPTFVGQVISRASEIAAESRFHNSHKYHVLLLITDGVLTDLQEVKDAIVKASDLPLSILIVGVGNADFTEMEILDADKGRTLESSTGQLATRDIVQFVPMLEVEAGEKSMVQSLLEELPNQFLTYMRSKEIKPLGALV